MQPLLNAKIQLLSLAQLRLKASKWWSCHSSSEPDGDTRQRTSSYKEMEGYHKLPLPILSCQLLSAEILGKELLEMSCGGLQWFQTRRTRVKCCTA